jgi:hypothetical protein
MRALG